VRRSKSGSLAIFAAMRGFGNHLRLRRRRCCSGRCSPLVRSTCARSMAGRRLQQNLPINQLTSLPDRVLSKC
jgi:hypothetical protein